jgi:type I restriction enzyme S subunit
MSATEWISFQDCLEKVTYTPKVQKSLYLETGLYPIVSQEAGAINGYWDDETCIFKTSKPIIVFGDHTRVLKYIDFNFVIGADGVKIIIPKNFIDTRYFYYLLMSVPIESKGYARHFRYFNDFKFSIPPLPVQKAIVAKLDAAFARIEQAITAAERNAENAKQLFQSYLSDVFERGGEGWVENKLADVCEKITDGTHQTPKYFDEGVIFLSSKNVTSGKIDWDKIKYIDEKQHNEMQRRVSPRLNDILLAKNGTTGVAAMVDRDVSFDIYVSLALLRAKSHVTPSYLLHFVNSPYAKKQFNGRLKGIGVPNLHLQEIREVIIRYPIELKQQEQMVARLETVSVANQRILSIYEQKTLALLNLKQSLLQQAFSGQLVDA